MFESFHEFRSRPGVSAVTVITIALGVAGATSMFAMLGAIGAAMVPPGVDASRIGRVVWTALDESGVRGELTAPEYVQPRGRHQRLRVVRTLVRCVGNRWR